ncbi:MAG: transcriptional repressor [Nitrospirota bacterium]
MNIPSDTGHGHHDHFVCLKCGKVTEVFDPKLESIRDELLCRKYRFKGVRHTLDIKGYCADCR